MNRGELLVSEVAKMEVYADAERGSADDLSHQAADGCYGKRIRSADDDVCMTGAVCSRWR